METETILMPPKRLINLLKNNYGLYIDQYFYVGFKKQIINNIPWREINKIFHLSVVTYDEFHDLKDNISNRDLLIKNISSVFPERRFINSTTQIVLVAGFDFEKDNIRYNISIIFSEKEEKKTIISKNKVLLNDPSTLLLSEIIPTLGYIKFRSIVESLNILNKVPA